MEFDINKLVESMSSVDSMTTATGRVYTKIGERDGVALKCNVDVCAGLFNTPMLGLARGLFVIIRFAEEKTPQSPRFNLMSRGDEQQSEQPDTVTLYRYALHGFPICLWGHRGYLLSKWNAQTITPLLRVYIANQAEAAGAKITIDTEAFNAIINRWQDEAPCPDPDFFTEAMTASKPAA